MTARAVLIRDRDFIRGWLRKRRRLGLDKYDEVRDGVLVVPVPHDNEHRRIVGALSTTFGEVVERACGIVLPGANVSSRDRGWRRDYRIPAVLVCLAGGTATDRDSHWYGGPDLAVEITTPTNDPREKLTFYGKIGTRELLVIDRDPWGLELYQLREGKLASVGRSEGANPAVLASGVLPLSFALRDAAPRPAIVVSHTQTAQTWTA